MEDRLNRLEHTVTVIEAKLPEFATKDYVDSRLSKTETKIILSVFGAAVATGIGGKFIPSTTVPAPAAPIVIQVPQVPASVQSTLPAAPFASQR